MRAIAWLLILVGLIVGVCGLLWALLPVVGLYESALSDPLSDKMPDNGKGIAGAMIPGAVVLAVGAVMSVAGKVMLVAAVMKGRRAREEAKKRGSAQSGRAT